MVELRRRQLIVSIGIIIYNELVRLEINRIPLLHPFQGRCGKGGEDLKEQVLKVDLFLKDHQSE